MQLMIQLVNRLAENLHNMPLIHNLLHVLPSISFFLNGACLIFDFTGNVHEKNCFPPNKLLLSLDPISLSILVINYIRKQSKQTTCEEGRR